MPTQREILFRQGGHFCLSALSYEELSMKLKDLCMQLLGVNTLSDATKQILGVNDTADAMNQMTGIKPDKSTTKQGKKKK